MPIDTTLLGFQKPDGNELVRGGDNVIAHNAQTANDLITAAQSVAANQGARLATVEDAAFASGALPLIEDPADPGFYLVGGGA